MEAILARERNKKVAVHPRPEHLAVQDTNRREVTLSAKAEADVDNAQSMPWHEALPYAFDAVLDNNPFATLPVVKGWTHHP